MKAATRANRIRKNFASKIRRSGSGSRSMLKVPHGCSTPTSRPPVEGRCAQRGHRETPEATAEGQQGDSRDSKNALHGPMHLWCGPPARAGGGAPATERSELGHARPGNCSSAQEKGLLRASGAPLAAAGPLGGTLHRASGVAVLTLSAAAPPCQGSFRSRPGAFRRMVGRNSSFSVPVRATADEARITAEGARAAAEPEGRETPSSSRLLS